MLRLPSPRADGIKIIRIPNTFDLAAVKYDPDFAMRAYIVLNLGDLLITRKGRFGFGNVPVFGRVHSRLSN